MKICIVGVGAIGGWMGVLLGQAADVELSAIARGATLQTLQLNGLQLTDASVVIMNLTLQFVRPLSRDQLVTLQAQDILASRVFTTVPQGAAR